MTAEDHGSPSTYRNHKCRCDKCKAANAKSVKEARLRRQKEGLPPNDPRHGKSSTYQNWKCRCKACTDAWAAECLASKKRNRTSEESK